MATADTIPKPMAQKTAARGMPSCQPARPPPEPDAGDPMFQAPGTATTSTAAAAASGTASGHTSSGSSSRSRKKKRQVPCPPPPLRKQRAPSVEELIQLLTVSVVGAV